MSGSKIFKKQQMDGMVMRDCTAAHAKFENVNLADCAFSNVNLKGAKFHDVNLSGVTIDDANIDGLTIFGHDIAALIRAEMKRTQPE